MPITDEQMAVISAASCSEDNVFFIGPYGSRVSFASQQRRALNLIWALDADEQLPRTGQLDAAVIGAGIAGITAVAALRSLDVNVTLFETKGHAMTLQEMAAHRSIHPTINFWPQEDLRWTTQLPYFDWYAASSAKEVIEKLYEQWSEETLGDCTPLFNTGVSGIQFDPDLQKVRVETALHDHLFDKVFVATGFGRERNCEDEDQPTYWNMDKVHELVTSDMRILVSGTGDGGVIDALRLVYRRFMDDEIALKYLLAVDSLRFQGSVKAIEKAGLRMPDLDKRAAYYHAEYTRLARAQPPNVQNILVPAHERLFPIPDREPKVVLLGRRVQPFEISSAPIHRLILAHTLDKGWITYRRGELKRKDDVYYRVHNGSRRKVREDVVIVRHGADPPIGDLIGAASAKALAKEQQKYGDFLHILGMDPDFFDDRRRGRSFVPNSPTLAEHRLPLANDFMLSRFGGRVTVSFEPNGEARYQSSPVDPAGYSDEFGQPPSELFNVLMVHGPRTISRVDPRVATSP